MKILLLLCALFLSYMPLSQAAQMPNTPVALRQVTAWQVTGGDKPLATPTRIASMNRQMLSSTMSDLVKYPASVSAATLTEYIKYYEMNSNLYVNGARYGTARAQALVNDALAGVRASNTVRYGVVIARSDLRSFPTLERSFKNAGETEFDRWQETAVDPGKPALVLASNGKGNFVFVQMADYRGWLPTNKVAITDRAQWLEYAAPKEFAVVTDKLLTVSGAGSSYWLYQMGSTIPVRNNLLVLPLRNAKGYLHSVQMPAPWGDRLHKGYLPYTQNNVVKMAFKHLDAPYGWGGMHNSVDCSSLVQDVYATVGLNLPRNGDEQENALPGHNMRGLTWAQRENLIKSLPVGSLFFTPYHVMLYLGQKDGRPYMLHALSSYSVPTASGASYKKDALQVVVSDVYLSGGSGTSLMMQMTKAITYR